MLEVLYDIATEEVRAWNADDSVQGNLTPKEGQEVIIFPINPPDFESDIYYVDLVNEVIVGNPEYVPTAPFNPKTEIDDLKARVETLENQ